MLWADEVLEKRAPIIAPALLALLAAPREWRHRRVETISFVTSRFVRRRVSVDFTVPHDFHEQLRLPVDPRVDGPADQWLIPVGWLARRQLVNFDLRERDG